MNSYERILASHEARLFEKDRVTIEVLRAHGGCCCQESSQKYVHVCTVLDVNSLIVQFDHTSSGGEDLFILIPQRYSWGELQVTKDVFKRILVHLDVSEAFLNVVLEFGSKVRHELPRSSTTSLVKHVRPVTSNNTECAMHARERHEVSYIIQYIERNGRDRGDPWSLRQTGVYSQTDCSTYKSNWIILQLSRLTSDLLKNELRRSSCPTKSDSTPFTIHALFLTATMRNWGEYVQDLSTQIYVLNEKAAVLQSSTIQMRNKEPDIRDVQKLQRIERKVVISSSALAANARVAEGLINHWRCPDAPVRSRSENSRLLIVSMAANLKVHQQSFKVLLDLVHSTSRLFSQVIETRRVERLQTTAELSTRHLDVLKSLAQDIRDENRSSGSLFANTQKDTRTMKALSTIATAFLPASLVATIFSSNLIQLEHDDALSSRATHFVMASQFWIYILVSMVLTGTTLGCIRVLEYWWTRRTP